MSTFIVYSNNYLTFCTNFPNVRGNPMKPLKSKVSITLDSDLIEKIRQLAEQDDRSFSQYINMILKEHIKNPEHK